MEPHSRNKSADAAVRRKRYRDAAGVSERIFWELVRKDKLGYRFRRQVSVGRYTLDFYCAAAQLAIELDGEQHDARRDEIRDAYLASCGIEVIRIPTLDLFEPSGTVLPKWLAAIENRCAERVEHFDSLRAGRRVPAEQ